MKAMYLLFGYLFALDHVISSDPDPRHVKCLVCRKVVEEIYNAIDKVNPAKMVEIGGFRLDSKGNTKKKTIPYSRSAVFLTEVLENVCERFEHYVKATYKSSGELTILQLVDENNKMNPELSKVDLIQDGDLNKSLKFYCEGIVGEYEDDFIKLLGAGEEDIDVKICSDIAQICDISISEDYNFEEKTEL